MSDRRIHSSSIITIRDDGRGIAVGRIYRKAVENGMYAADAPRPRASEIANLIFASGFSTAEQVTEINEYADGAIVGSAFVRAYQNDGLPGLVAKVRELRARV